MSVEREIGHKPKPKEAGEITLEEIAVLAGTVARHAVHSLGLFHHSGKGKIPPGTNEERVSVKIAGRLPDGDHLKSLLESCLQNGNSTVGSKGQK